MRSVVPRMAAAAALAVAACVSFEGPPGQPHGTYPERLETFARLLRMEDTRNYDPLLAGHASSSPDAWLRAKTALAVGRLKDMEAIPYLPVLLEDREPSVRRAAAFGAGVAGDRRLVRFVAAALRDPDAEVRANAAEALSKIGGDEAVSALIEAAGKEAPAAGQLWRFPEARVVERLIPLAGGERGHGATASSVATAALYALARRPLPQSAPALRRALAEADAQSAAYAARALGILGQPDSAALLVAAARRPEPSVAIQSLLALEKIGAKSPLDADARTLALSRSAEPHPGLAVAAIRLLSRFPADREVEARLTELARGSPAPAAVLGSSAVAASQPEKLGPPVGWRGQIALVSLARASPERAMPLLGEALSGGSLEARLAAAEAVGVLPLDAAVEIARRGLEDRAPRVRALVITSLPNDLATKHTDLLMRALKDSDAAVRSEALAAAAPFARTGVALREAWDRAFQRALRESDPDFTVGALDAAALLTGPAPEATDSGAAAAGGGRALIEPLVDAKDAVVREKARRLMVEKFGAERSRFRAIPVKTRYGLEDYRRLARGANEELLAARVEVRGRGAVQIALAAEETPLTVASFRELADRGFFRGIVIHRVVPDFVVQAGDPRGDGSGGPGYAIRDEINPLRYERGAVGMALSGPDTGGSQWFVTLSPQPHLDGGYTVFGKVTSGLDVVDSIEQDDVLTDVSVTVARRASVP